MTAGAPDESVRAAFLASDEYLAGHGAGDTTFVTALYRQVLGRAADAGLGWWVAQLGQGVSRSSVALAFVTSSEARRDTVSRDFSTVLGRPPDPNGLTFWANQLMRGATDEQVVASLVGSDEFSSRAVTS
jgi:hypothetical protein